MKNSRSPKIDVLIFGLLIIAGIISWRFYFQAYIQQDSVSVHAFPRTVGKWTSEEIPISDNEYAILETRNVFIRKYTSPEKEEVYLYVVYSQNNRKISHPPEICYTGGGETILSKKNFLIPVSGPEKNLTVNELHLDQGTVEQISIYWFKVGSQFTSDYLKQQFLLALNSLTGKPSSSAMIRVSSVINGKDLTTTEDVVKKFSQLILPELKKYLP
ncbi:MAG: EpsI family protein [Candidatus Omnitrophica bacterium]|nr:EpsI family protein [Candidatus Omnitrophota bacterium]